MALVKKCLRQSCPNPINPPDVEVCRKCQGVYLEEIDDPAYAVCRHCNAVQEAARSQCADCDKLLKRVARLRFPWGEERLAEGNSVTIGRRHGEFVDRLSDPQYRTVSREHARLYWSGPDLMLRELESQEGAFPKNGTFVNGSRLPAGGEQKLDADCVVRLSSRLPVAIAFEA